MAIATTYGFDPLVTASTEIMGSIENVVGEDKFDEILRRYQVIRESKKADNLLHPKEKPNAAV